MRGKGVHDLAEELLGLIDSIDGVPEAKAFVRLAGIGGAKASAVCAALELGRRLYGVRDKNIASPGDVWPVVSHWADRKQERLVCCGLNGAHELIAVRVVSVGRVNETVVGPFSNKYRPISPIGFRRKPRVKTVRPGSRPSATAQGA
jgi:DNA repair protein RadC